MRTRTVTFAVADSLVERAGSGWMEPILAHWPRPDVRPSAEIVRLAEFRARAEILKPGLDTDPASVAVVVLDHTVTHAQACQLVDRMQEQLIPGLLLFPNLDGAAARLQYGGVLTDSHSADPARLAAMVYSLAERQTIVHSLARDLRVAQRSQGGLKGEMDKIHEEMHLAAAVQRELLPKELPSVPGLSFSAIFRPVGYVSGDIYDLRPIDDNRIAFFIADAVGHGLPAALLTVALSRGLTTRDRTGDSWQMLEPAESLSRLNRDLCLRQHSVQRFATAVYGYIDTRTRRVTLAGAGHPPPLLFSSRGMERLETDGPLMGVFADAEFNQISVTLDPGQTLVLYTDGLESAFPARDRSPREFRRPTNGYFSYLAQLADLANTPGGSLEGATRALSDILDDQAGSLHQVDDITTVALSAPLAARAAAA